MRPIERILMADHIRDVFEAMLCTVMEDDQVTLGNVEFWVDRTGPIDEFAFSIPHEQWKGVEEALRGRLEERFTPRELELIELHVKAVKRRAEGRLRRN